MISVEQIEKWAIEEAEAINIHATDEQKELLLSKFDEEFDPTDKTLCIYGLMTGNCFLKETGQLMKKVQPKMVANDLRIKSALNKSEKFRGVARGRHFTALEFYAFTFGEDIVKETIISRISVS